MCTCTYVGRLQVGSVGPGSGKRGPYHSMGAKQITRGTSAQRGLDRHDNGSWYHAHALFHSPARCYDVVRHVRTFDVTVHLAVDGGEESEARWGGCRSAELSNDANGSVEQLVVADLKQFVHRGE